MRLRAVKGLFGLLVGSTLLYADVSEMIFYPEADFSEGVLHYNYQGQKNRNYGFMFDRGFDPERIVYVRPALYTVEKSKEGYLKLLFPDTDRYSYIQRAYREDFVVSDENGVLKILLNGGVCSESPNCVTAESILSVNVPKGYGVRKYEGLDQNLKPLKSPKWLRKGNLYTLTAHDVKGAYILLELEKGKAGIPVPAALPLAASEPVNAKPVSSADAASAVPVVTLFQQAMQVQAAAPAVSKPLSAKTPIVATAVKPESPKVMIQAPVVSASVPEKAPPVLVASKSEPQNPPLPAVAVKAAAEKAAPVITVKPPMQETLPSPVAAAPKCPGENPAAVAEGPAPYFRNFQIFESQRILELSEGGKERLREWAKQFKEGGYKSVSINGYTDNIPPQRIKHLYATNEILSAARAKAVADYLSSVGVDSKAITVKGLGGIDPVAPNDTEEGRSKNRRIEFVLGH